ncbi:MAG TPA: iron-containing alcohol dehydrogenase [Nitrososphaera sp.]|jgi:3-dehydroquinate synthase
MKRYPTYSAQVLQQMLLEYILQAVDQLQSNVFPVSVRYGAISFAGVISGNATVTKAADLYFSWGKWNRADMPPDTQTEVVFFLKQQLEQMNPKITWFIVNDVIAAAYRYQRLYPQVQKLVLLTISTGIGYAFSNKLAGDLSDNDLVSLGHKIIDFSNEARDCDCGERGHLAAYFSGKAVEKRVREHATHNLQEFIHSSLCCLLRDRFSSTPLEERKAQFQSAVADPLMRDHAALVDEQMITLLHKDQLSIGELCEDEAFLLAMLMTNEAIAMAINDKDGFVMRCLDEMMEKFALGFQDILNLEPEKIVIMGGFVLSIKDVFLEVLTTHMSIRSAGRMTREYLEKRIEWGIGDELDGVIGAVCAGFGEEVQDGVTRLIDAQGSTVFEVQAYTEKRTSYVQTCNMFALQNKTLADIFTKRGKAFKALVVIGASISWELGEKVSSYFEEHAISFHLHRLANTTDTVSVEDVEILLLAAKTFGLGRKDCVVSIGDSATLHCGGLTAAIYRRGIAHMCIPLDDQSLRDIALGRYTVNLDDRGKSGSLSNFHPPAYILLDESLHCQFHQVPLEMKTMQQVDRYKVEFVNDLFAQHNTRLSSYVPEKKAFVVISEAAHVIFGEKIKVYLSRNGIEHRYYVYAGGENKKYWCSVLDIVRQLLMEQDPREMLISIGGGTTMDLSGFAAALTSRRYIRIPTTLLGVIDAGIGVKVGCNFQGSKNFLGDFYAPLTCLNDVSFLQTVSPRDMRAGLAEILKMGIIREPHIVEIVEDYHSLLVPSRLQTGRYASSLLKLATYWMLKELQSNLHEDRTLKRLVDFGHAFSPCIEIKSDHRVLHGEAVAIDMALCAQIAFLQGHCMRETRDRIINVLLTSGLPVFDDVCRAEDLLCGLQEIRLARGGHLHLPVPERVGKMIFIEHISLEDLKEAVAYLHMISLGEKADNLLGAR